MRFFLPLTFALALASAWHFDSQDGVRLLDASYHHLGDDEKPEWKEATARPEGKRYDLRFRGATNRGEWVLAIRHRGIGQAWRLIINGVETGCLHRGEKLVERYYSVPSGLLKDGENLLSVLPDDPADDMTLGAVRLIEASLREHMKLSPVVVRVSDLLSGDALPARISVVSDRGGRPFVFYGERKSTAVREGVIYTRDGEARFELPPGKYQVFATRGSEWSLDQGELTIGGGRGASLELALEREVNTAGYVACDTHIHTLTFSGHGDASIDERMVTLAGEGVELAISTDHNHSTDYRPHAKRHGVERYFTSVVGNEVTTDVGHFNAFPLDPNAAIPPFAGTDHEGLIRGMRAKGAKVVILNHPRWPDHRRGPFGIAGIDHFTGERLYSPRLLVDATELVNSDTLEEDPMLLFHDWFALLNWGERLVAVGSSDSHTVESPVGQGRTYVSSASDDPTRIDVDACCAAIAAGRSTFGLGIFADVRVGADPDSGQAVSAGGSFKIQGGSVPVRLHVRAPAWIRPERVRLFINGIEVGGGVITAPDSGPTDLALDYRIDWPYDHDGWLVCVVTGAPVKAPYWTTLQPYTMAGTNPVYLDGDGDGSYRSPRHSAQARLDRAAALPAQALEGCDGAVAVQVLSMLLNEEPLADAPAGVQRNARSMAKRHPYLRAYIDQLETSREHR